MPNTLLIASPGLRHEDAESGLIHTLFARKPISSNHQGKWPQPGCYLQAGLWVLRIRRAPDFSLVFNGSDVRFEASKGKELPNLG